MKKQYLSQIAVALLFGMLTFCLFRIIALENQLQSLQSNISTQISNLDNNVSGIYYDVQRALDEESSLLSSQDWAYGEVDIAHNEINVQFTISPKEYSPENTEALLVFEGTEYPMSLVEGGRYTAVVGIPLFAESSITSVQLRENGVVRAQELDLMLSPRYDFLPMVYARFDGSGSGRAENGVFLDGRTGLIVIDVEHKGIENHIEQANLIYVMNGEEIKRVPVDLSYEGQKSMVEKEDRVNSQRALPEPQAFASGEYSQFFYYLEELREIPYGSTLELYVEAVDNFGFHHYTLCDAVAVDAGGDPQFGGTEWPLVGAEGSIYDAGGNPLYIPDESLYR